LEAVALTLGLDDPAAVREPVERGSGEPLGTEHLGPRFEGKVRGDDETGALVSGRDDVEEQSGFQAEPRGTFWTGRRS